MEGAASSATATPPLPGSRSTSRRGLFLLNQLPNPLPCSKCKERPSFSTTTRNRAWTLDFRRWQSFGGGRQALAPTTTLHKIKRPCSILGGGSHFLAPATTTTTNARFRAWWASPCSHAHHAQPPPPLPPPISQIPKTRIYTCFAPPAPCTAKMRQPGQLRCKEEGGNEKQAGGQGIQGTFNFFFKIKTLLFTN